MNSTLAIHGGPKAVPEPPPRLKRWGKPELERLAAMVHQHSLFYWNGPQTSGLFEEFRQHYPLRHLMPCSSGTAALHIAVAALQLPPGSEVLVPAITDMGSVIGILYQQLVPVFVDIDPATGNMDPADLAHRLTPATRAIIPVHLAGTPCDIESLLAFAKQHKLRVIEDCAQAWGATWHDTPVGLFGDLAAYSFNEFKHLSCGDGGLVGTNDDALGRDLCKWGDKYYDRVAGSRNPAQLAPNYRMSEPQAAVCAAQLTRLDAIVSRREAIGRRLAGRLGGLPGITPMAIPEGARSSYWFFFIRIDEAAVSTTRDEFAKALSHEGVQAEAGYIPSPVYRYDVFQNHAFFGGRWPLREHGDTTMDYRNVRCPNAEQFLRETVLLRIHEGMTDDYIDAVASAVAKVAHHYSNSA